MKYNPEALRSDLITKRLINDRLDMDKASSQIGISKSTLSRLENGKLPDVDTLAKCCAWLGTEPNKYFATN